MSAVAEKTSTALAVTIDRTELADCLAACAAVTRKRTPHEVLKCVRVTAGDKWVEFEATNLEVRVRRTARKVVVDSPGVALVNAEDFAQWVKVADGDNIKMASADDSLVANGTSCNRKFYTRAARDFPSTPPDETELAKYTLAMGDLRTAFGFIRHSLADAATRYAYHGFLIEHDKAGTTLVATDGHRLSATTVKAETAGKELNTIIHGDNFAAVLAGMVYEDDAPVGLSVAKGSVMVECGDAEAWIIRIEGNFPPYADIIPRDHEGSAKLSRVDLIDTVRRASAAIGDMQVDRRLKVEASKAGFSFSLLNPTRGESSANLPCRVDGAGIVLGIDTKLLLAFLTAATGDEVEWLWTAPNRPSLFKCGARTEVIMHMNLR